MNRQALAHKIASDWLEKTVKNVDPGAFVTGFIKALEKHLKASLDLVRALNRADPVDRKLALTGYPKRFAPIDQYAKELQQYQQRLRNTIKAESWEAKQAAEPTDLIKALYNWILSAERATVAWNQMEGNSTANFVKNLEHRKDVPHGFFNNQYLETWANKAIDRLKKGNEPSAREQLAMRISDFVRDNNLAGVYGGDVTLAASKRYYGILIDRPRNMDGIVKVFSPKFIQVIYQTRYLSLPTSDSRVFTSERDAINFLKFAFVDLDFDKALAITTK